MIFQPIVSILVLAYVKYETMYHILISQTGAHPDSIGSEHMALVQLLVK